MVDFHSQYKLYHYRATVTSPAQPVESYRELYRESTPHLFRSQRPLVHDCREPIVQDFSDKHEYDVFILSQGIKETSKSKKDLHAVVQREGDDSVAKPNKLIYTIGNKGRDKNEFLWPRGLAISSETGDLFIADCGNHRVKIYNNHGVLKHVFGVKGKGTGEFNEPCDVVVLPDETIAVLDKKNKRIQVFAVSEIPGSFNAKFKYEFPTCGVPVHLACNHDYDIIVSTMSRSIEVYRRGGSLLHRFRVDDEPSEGGAPLFLCTNDNKEIIISDPSRGTVGIYTLNGRLLYGFRPQAAGLGLTVIPGSVCVNLLQQIIVVDSLNHTISQYTERGVLLKQILAPQDDLGAAQTCLLGPEGHLVVTEFSANGPHHFKIFRYRECQCHATRPNSSKRNRQTESESRFVVARRTPTPQQE